MTAPVAVVVDTNIFFSALLSSHTTFGETILTSTEHVFYVSETTVAELFEHKEKLVRSSRMSPDDLATTFHLFLRRLTLIKEESLSQSNRDMAYRLCQHIDPEDAPHVALALELDALLWTGDKKLREGLRAQGFDRFFLTG